MNAPATLAQVQPAAAVRAEDLASLDLIRTLVGFDTTSRDSNLALIDWVRDYLRRVRHRDRRSRSTTTAARPTCSPRCPRATATRRTAASCCPATPTSCRSTASRGTPTRSPSRVKDDRLYGRGVTDMKSFSAVGLSFVPEFLRRGLERSPLHFALSYDEEVGCIGVRRLIADIVARGMRPAGCIVGEPTGMELVVAHKGKKAWRCRVRGFEAHSSLTPQRRQRGADRVRDRRVHRAACARIPRRRRAATTRTTCPTPPCTSARFAAAPRSTSCRATARSTSRSATCRSTIPMHSLRDVQAFAARFLPEMHAVDPATYIEFDAAVHAARLRHARRQRDHRARPRVQRHAGRRQGLVRHRSLAVPRRERADDHLRTGPHRAGAPAQRMGLARAGRALRERSCSASVDRARA